MTKSLDDILSGNGEAVPEQPEANQEQVTQETQVSGQAESNPPEGGERETQPQGQKMVPHEALHAERQKVKRYTEEVADFRKQLQETNAQWERRMAQLIETIKPQQAQQAPPDWWENPGAATGYHIDQRVNPLEQKFMSLESQILRLTAIQQYGAEKVSAFEKYVQDAMSSNDPEIATLAAQMRASPDPMKVGLDWYEKRTFDPAAKEAEIEARILEKYGIDPNKPQQQQPAPSVMPSNLAGARNVGNRSGPAWAGPPTINDIFKR